MPTLTRWRTNGQANQGSQQLLRNTEGADLHTHTIASDQPDRTLSHHVVSRMATIDRYRKMGRNLKAQGRWADTHSVWQQALDILTELTVRHPHVPDLQRHWCDCGNDLAWLLLNHPDSRGPAYALTLAMQVVDKCSDGDVYWNTLGVAYLRNGDPGMAIAALNRAMVWPVTTTLLITSFWQWRTHSLEIVNKHGIGSRKRFSCRNRTIQIILNSSAFAMKPVLSLGLTQGPLRPSSDSTGRAPA